METFVKVDVVFRSGAVFHKRLIFYFIIKVYREEKKLPKMKYFQLKNEYHQWKGLEKQSKKTHNYHYHRWCPSGDMALQSL